MSNYRKLSKSGKYSSYKGKFIPLHKDKYKGDSFPEFKSKLEQSMMNFCDKNSLVLSWSYERIIVHYKDTTRRLVNGEPSTHRYYVDFKIVMKTTKGPKTFLVEVKSGKETVPPTKSKRKKPENYKKEVITYARNQCKWEAANRSCRSRGWEFKILTEKELK